MKDIQKLRKIIREIAESLGKLKPRAFHGSGTSHPFTVKAVKQQLGPVQIPENELSAPPRRSVKISRAFKRTKSDL